MVPVEEALEKQILPKILVLESISERLRKLLSLGANRAGLGIQNLT